jgi:glucosamine kinase
MRLGFETVRAAIMSATLEAFSQAGLPEAALARTYAGIGLAGTGRSGARATLEEWRHPFAGAWFEGDGYLAMLGAFGGEDGGIVIVGTGSIGLCYQDEVVRIGGYGFPVSDDGSGADIGLNAIRHALRTFDGRAEPSRFSAEVLAAFSNDHVAVIDWLEEARAADYAMFAPLVVKYAAEGDPAAHQIMLQAAIHIGEIIDGLMERGARRVALSGGLAQVMQEYLPARIVTKLTRPQADAMAGGILLAKRRLAHPHSPKP